MRGNAETRAGATHGGQIRQLAVRMGVAADGLLDFSANINPDGPPPGVVPALLSALKQAETLTVYPDVELASTRRVLAEYAGCAVAEVAIANGFVPLLEAAVRAFGVQRCLVPMPCFVEYRPALERAGVLVEALGTTEYDARLLEGSHEAILLANPQNPTGLLSSQSALKRLLASGRTILLDEAFIDYAPESSLAPLVGRYANLVVFRSVTKLHAIPGLRLAYLIAQNAAAIASELAPWPVSTLATVAVEAALPDRDYLEQSLELNASRRETLALGLQDLGLQVSRSAANFLLLRLPDPLDAAAFHERMVRRHGLVVRLCNDYEGLVPGHLRVAVRNERDNDRLLTAFAEMLASSMP